MLYSFACFCLNGIYLNFLKIFKHVISKKINCHYRIIVIWNFIPIYLKFEYTEYTELATILNKVNVCINEYLIKTLH